MRRTILFASILSLPLIACAGAEPDPETSTSTAGTGGAAASTSSTGLPHPGDLSAAIDATPDTGDGPVEVTLSACESKAGAADPIVFYAWDLGDGTAASGSTVKHTYSTGSYDVKLVVTTAAGATATASKTITAKGPMAVALTGDATSHPRLYFDAKHASALHDRVNKTPILGDTAYLSSYVNGYLIQPKAWEGASFYASAYSGCNVWAKDATGSYKCQENPKTGPGCMYLNEDGFDDSSKPDGAFSNPVFVGRRLSDCLTTTAAGALFETDMQRADRDAKAAISGLYHMATVWPSTGKNTAGFGRWICGSCGIGSNLNNGELLFSAAVAYDLLWDRMSPSERTAIRDLLVREARWVYGASTHDEASVPGAKDIWWSKDGANNWDAVIHGGLGVAAIVLDGEDGMNPGEAQTWIDYAKKRIHHYLDTNFDADGVNYEDLDHGDYGMEFAGQFLWALRGVKGDDDFGYRDGVAHKYLRYRVNAVEPPHDGLFRNDSVGRSFLTYPTALLLASAYRDPFAQWSWDRISGASRPKENDRPFKAGGDGAQSQLFLTGVSYDDTVRIESPAERLPLGVVYPDFGRALFRTDWEDPKASFLGFESGVFGSHGKPNQGHFVFTAEGSHFIDGLSTADQNSLPIDPSTNKKALPLEMSSGGYNLLLVDGKQKSAPQGSELEKLATTRAWLDAPLVDYVSSDTTKAYGSNVDSARRDILFVHPVTGQDGYAVVLDSASASATHEFSWQAHRGKGTSFVSAGAGHSRIEADSGAALDVLQVAPLGSSSSFIKLDVTSKSSATDTLLTTVPGVKEVAFATLLFPSDAGKAPPSLDAGKKGSLATIAAGGDSIGFDPGGNASAGDAATDGDVVLARASSLYFAADATKLTVAGHDVVTASAPSAFALVTEESGARVWIGGSSAGPVDVKIALEAGVRYVVSVDDALLGVLDADTSGFVAVQAIDRAKARTLVIARADAASCQ